MNFVRACLLAALLAIASPHQGTVAAKLFNLGPVCATPEAVEPAVAVWSNGDSNALLRLGCIAFADFDLQVRVVRCGRGGPSRSHEAWVRMQYPTEIDPALPPFVCEIAGDLAGNEKRLFTNFLNILWAGEAPSRPPPAERQPGSATDLASSELFAALFFLEPSDLSLEIPPRRVVEAKLLDRWPVCTTPEAVEPADAASSRQDWSELRRLDCVRFTKADLQVRVIRCGSAAKTPRHEPWMRFYYPVEFDQSLPKYICEIEASIPNLRQTRLYTDFANIRWHG